MIEEIGISWAAGFYDGEGSVSCTENNGNLNSRIQLSIGQKDYNVEIADTLTKFKKIVGCGHIYRKTKAGKEINQHQFIICKASDVESTIKLLWKYLSLSKQEQALTAFTKLKGGQEDIRNKYKDSKMGFRGNKRYR